MTNLESGYDSLTFRLDQLLQMLRGRHAGTFLISAAVAVAARAQMLTTDVNPESQDILSLRLLELLDSLTIAYRSSDPIVHRARRALACNFRLSKRFVYAEKHDRLDPQQSLSHLVVLAQDILSQQNPARRGEVVAIYRQALEIGLKDLPATIFINSVWVEIASVYVSLARVLLADGKMEEAEAELSKLIALYEENVKAQNINADLTETLLDAYRELLNLAVSQFKSGDQEAMFRNLAKAAGIAWHLTQQDFGSGEITRKVTMIWKHTTAYWDWDSGLDRHRRVPRAERREAI